MPEEDLKQLQWSAFSFYELFGQLFSYMNKLVRKISYIGYKINNTSLGTKYGLIYVLHAKGQTAVKATWGLVKATPLCEGQKTDRKTNKIIITYRKCQEEKRVYRVKKARVIR